MTLRQIRRCALAVGLTLMLSGCVNGGHENDTRRYDGVREETPQVVGTDAKESRNPPVFLTVPTWPALSGSAITSIISDRRLTIDEDYEPAPGLSLQVASIGGCHPQETFYADGRWTIRFCFRAPTVFDGKWTIEAYASAERLCVEAPEFPKTCRFVWQGGEPNQLFMSASVSMEVRGRGENVFEIFNPYRLSPIWAVNARNAVGLGRSDTSLDAQKPARPIEASRFEGDNRMTLLKRPK